MRRGRALDGVVTVHEAAAATVAGEVGIGDRHLVGLTKEAAQQARVRTEFFRASGELASVADHDAHTSVHGTDDAADEDVLILVAAQFTDLTVVGIEAEHEKAALGIRHGERTDIEEACAVLELDHIVDMRADADILAKELGRLIGLDAGPRRRVGMAAKGMRGR